MKSVIKLCHPSLYSRIGAQSRYYSTAKSHSPNVSEFLETRLMESNDSQKMSESESLFSTTEMNRRLGAFRSHLIENTIDCALLSSMHNVAYFSDFLYCSFGRKYGLFISSEMSDDCSQMTLIQGALDMAAPWRRVKCDTLSYTDWKPDNYYYAIAQMLRKYKLDSQRNIRIGIEFDHFTLEAMTLFKNYFSDYNLEFIDISKATMQQRLIKSTEEHDLYRNTAEIANIGGNVCMDALKENATEYEVAMECTAAMYKEIAKRYPTVDLRDTWVWLQSGLNTDGCHNALTTRQIKSGDIVSMNTFPMIHGYYTALERTLFLNHCSDAHRYYWDINTEVYKKGLELVKPGARCCDIAAELNEIYASYDVCKYRAVGYGHSFGIMSPYWGREAGLEFRETCETVLQPGMIVSMEPSINIPESMAGAGTYREHDLLAISHDGVVENFTQPFPVGSDEMILTK